MQDMICSVKNIDGAAVSDQDDLIPSLLIEIPHGATKSMHFKRYQQALQGDFPSDLIDFFHVNTDVGAPECAEEIAVSYTCRFPKRRVQIIRCHVPRTFIDCNRVIDGDPAAFKEGKVTPGIPSYVRDTVDQAFLREQYQRYHQIVEPVFKRVCSAGGYALFLHTYAPKSVGISTVDDDIVKQLHWAYSPDVYSDWPLRPEIDVICRDLEGKLLTNPAWLDTFKEILSSCGYKVADGQSYPLHPVTMAHQYWQRFPNQILCLEIRRDLLVEEFSPFHEMQVDPNKIKVIADGIAQTIPSSLDLTKPHHVDQQPQF